MQGGSGSLGVTQCAFVMLLMISSAPKAALAAECSVQYSELPCTFGNCTFMLDFIPNTALRQLLKRVGNCTSTSETLYLHRDSLITQLDPGIFSNMPATMKTLQMDNNGLTAIDNQIFAQLVHVENLVLANNDIASIADQAFAAMLRLRMLDLSQNKIPSVGARMFAGHPSLRQLFLGANLITSMDSKWNAGLQLTNLRMSQNPTANSIGCLPGTAVQFSALESYFGSPSFTGRCCAGNGNSEKAPDGGCVCGKGASGNNGSACAGCPAGKFKGVIGDAPCSSCLDPNASPNVASLFVAASTVCQCNAGSIGSDGGECTLCQAGSYTAVQGASACVLCPPGTFSTTVGANTSSMCTTCPATSSSPAGSDGQQDCTCNAGMTGPNGGPCGACDAGKYKTAAGSYACSDCPANSHSPSASKLLTNCTCKDGFKGPAGGPCSAPCSVGLKLLLFDINDDTFTADKQSLFKKAMAATVGVAHQDVSIQAVNETTVANGAGITVEVGIKTWVCSPPQTPTPFELDKFNSELAKEGLPRAEMLEESCIVSLKLLLFDINDDTFTADKQSLFKKAMAATVGVAHQDVSIQAVNETTVANGVGITVEVGIKTWVCSPPQTPTPFELDKFNSELAKVGLPRAEIWKEAAELPPGTVAAPIAAIIFGILGAIAAVVALYEFVLFEVRHKKLHLSMKKFHDAHVSHASAIKRLHSVLEQHDDHKHLAEELKQMHSEKVDLVSSHRPAGLKYFKLSAVFPSKDEHHDVHSSRVRLKTEHEKELEGRLHDALAKVKLFQRACQTAHDLHANHSSAIKRLHSILEKHEEHKHHAEELKQMHSEKEEIISAHKETTLSQETEVQITNLDAEESQPPANLTPTINFPA